MANPFAPLTQARKIKARHGKQSLLSGSDPAADPCSRLLHLAIHGHKHTSGDDILRGNFSHFSRQSRGALASIGMITTDGTTSRIGARRSTQLPPCKSPIHHGAQKECPGTGFYNTSDVSRGITKVEVGYAPGSGRIGSLKFLDRGGAAVLSWNMYTCTAAGWKAGEVQQKLEVKTVVPPAADGVGDNADGEAKEWIEGEQAQGQAVGMGNKGGWELAGFWGRADVVIQHIGMIWRRT